VAGVPAGHEVTSSARWANPTPSAASGAGGGTRTRGIQVGSKGFLPKIGKSGEAVTIPFPAVLAAECELSRRL